MTDNEIKSWNLYGGFCKLFKGIMIKLLLKKKKKSELFLENIKSLIVSFEMLD